MKKSKRVWALSILLFWCLSSAHNLWAQCEIDPFPPFPPSPPEFKKGILAQASSKGVYLSWEQIPDQEGFLVSVCKGTEGFMPLAAIEENSLLVTQIPESGTYTFQVKAYVKVDQNFVFNGGTVVNVQAQAVGQESPDGGSTDQGGGVETSFPSPPKKTLAFDTVHALSGEYPGFDGSRSFYSPVYPEVRNPLVPKQAEDGTIIPALLTDAGIERTVARVYAKRGVQVAAAPGIPSNPQATPTVSNPPVKQSMTGEQPSSDPESVASQEAEDKNLTVKPMTPEKDPDKISTQPVKSQRTGSSEKPAESMGAQRGLFLLVGVLILGVIYFLFRKESQ